MKKILYITLVSFLLSFGAYSLLPTSVSAQQIEEYTLLAPIPLDGTLTQKLEGENIFEKYIPGIFTTLIAFAAVLAVGRIIWGGVLYISTDAIQGKSEGKKYITESIYGLILISTAWLILYTVNPRLVEINLSIAPTQVDSTLVGVGYGDESTVRTYLAKPEINILVNAGPCSGTQTTGCTSLAGLSTTAVNGLTALREACQTCGLRITGGTEGGHQTHGVGQGRIDLEPQTSLNNFLTGKTDLPPDGTRVTKQLNGRDVVFTYETKDANSSGNHWHVSFN